MRRYIFIILIMLRVAMPASAEVYTLCSKVQLQVPTSENPIFGAVVEGAFYAIPVDIDGQIRPETLKDAGCDQLSDEDKNRSPLTKDDVGANYELSAYSQMLQKPNYNIPIENGALKLSFEKGEKLTVLLYLISGKLLSTSQVYARNFQQTLKHFPRFIITEMRETNYNYAVKLIQ